ncbi:MarR family winged helix-turn-helix transcriptional regulator [Actinomadura algeriensis]|uniref:DNA-binding MarR family transcriptional regulator n=1 Tax=Actinomadura algeriensis TaxID=1679523 RepID=A0ABR9JK98_9ACTN|nr:MarR family transcriptional regulator [Actinomadura algeriensis]MBE1530979.1 DNA-binding MarR family transcriptional regulator [Actinomadura algeriensis]
MTERPTGDPGMPEAPDAVLGEFGVLLSTVALLERIAGRELERRCGIRHAAFEVLLRLSDAARPVSMGELAGELILTSGGMTRLIDRMETAGLVARRAAPGDRRGRRVELTGAGRAKLDEAMRVHAETLRRHFAGPLTDEGRRGLAESLRTLRAHAREELDLR